MNRFYHITLLALFSFTLTVPSTLRGFGTIEDILQYAQKVEEFPDSDLDRKGILAQTNPTFHQFYPTIDPSFFGKIACRLRLTTPMWCFSDFIGSVQRSYEQESNRPWHTQNKNLGQLTGANIVGCIATEELSLIIVGELSGAFHSLTHIMQHWYKAGIIDKTFKLKDDKKHIIFLGEVIGTSAYNLEILTAIGSLMKQNPKNVWYLCGYHEERQRWHETPLYHAITVRSHLKRNEIRSIYQLVDSFFSVLPKAFVITSESQQEIIACASHNVFDQFTLDELYTCATTITSKEIKNCQLYGSPASTTTGINLLALLETRRLWSTAYIQPPIEKIVLPTTKATVWDLVSGTTRALLSTYLFRWYGYFVLTVHGKHLEKSTLEYIGRRADFEDTFRTREIYNVVTGELISEPKA